MNKVFSEDFKTQKELIITEGAPISDVAKRISLDVSEEAVKKGDAFADEIEACFISDFEKEGDKICGKRVCIWPERNPKIQHSKGSGAKGSGVKPGTTARKEPAETGSRYC